jgi:hypothetical protein
MDNVFTDPIQFKSDVEKYFADCEQDNRRTSALGLANHLGTLVRTLHNYKARPGFGEVLELAKQRMEEQAYQRLENRDYATAGVIFNLTNNYGWKQPNQIEHSGSIAVAHSHVPPDVQIELDAHRAEIEGAPADENPS